MFSLFLPKPLTLPYPTLSNPTPPRPDLHESGLEEGPSRFLIPHQVRDGKQDRPPKSAPSLRERETGRGTGDQAQTVVWGGGGAALIWAMLGVCVQEQGEIKAQDGSNGLLVAHQVRDGKQDRPPKSAPSLRSRPQESYRGPHPKTLNAKHKLPNYGTMEP